MNLETYQARTILFDTIFRGDHLKLLLGINLEEEIVRKMGKNKKHMKIKIVYLRK